MQNREFEVEFDREQIRDALREWGVVVIRNVYSDKQCHEFVQEFTKRNAHILSKLPQAKPGQYKDLICNDPALWQVRREPRWAELWTYLYSELSGAQVSRVFASIDGVNIKSDHTAPHYANNKDWAHLDQTNGEPFDCIQGQLVFSNSSAGFVCSPKSHLIFDQVMRIMQVGPNDQSNWCPINQRASKAQLTEVQRQVVAVGGRWQELILAPRGSAILWLSSTIHSARIAVKPAKSIVACSATELEHWRAVMYLAFVQEKHLDRAAQEKRWLAMRTNRSLNHWCQIVWEPYVPAYDQNVATLLRQPQTYPGFDAELMEDIIQDEVGLVK